MITFSTLPLSFECFYSKSSMLNWDNTRLSLYHSSTWNILSLSTALLWEFAKESMSERDSLSLSMLWMRVSLCSHSLKATRHWRHSHWRYFWLQSPLKECDFRIKPASLPHLSILLFQTHSASSSAGGHYDQGSSFTLICFHLKRDDRKKLTTTWLIFNQTCEWEEAIRTHLAQFVHFSFSHFWHFNCRSDWMTKCDLGLLCGNYYYCLRQWCQWWFTV